MLKSVICLSFLCTVYTHKEDPRYVWTMANLIWVIHWMWEVPICLAKHQSRAMFWIRTSLLCTHAYHTHTHTKAQESDCQSSGTDAVAQIVSKVDLSQRMVTSPPRLSISKETPSGPAAFPISVRILQWWSPLQRGGRTGRSQRRLCQIWSVGW